MRLEAGPAGRQFASHIELLIVAAYGAKGIIGLWRAELEAHNLVTKIAIALNVELAAVSNFLGGPLGLVILALGAIAAAAYFYKRQIDENIESTKGLTEATKQDRDAREADIVSLARAAQAHQALVEAQKKVREEIEIYLRIRLAREHADRVAAEAEDALKKALPLQELQSLIAHERALDQIRTILVPHALQEASAMHEVVYEAKEAIIVQTALADAQAKLEASLVPLTRAGYALAEAHKHIVTEARDVTTSAADAQRVLDVTAEHVSADAQRMGTAFESTTRSIIQITTQGADIFSNLWVTAINQVIDAMLRAKAVSSFFGSIATGILGFLGLQHGGTFVATGPTPLLVGEAGAELVSVTPLTGGGSAGSAPAGRGGGGDTNVSQSFEGPVFFDDISAALFVRRYLQPALRTEGARRLT
jgi:hypothetical protein